MTSKEFETWFRETPCSFQPPSTFVFIVHNRFRKAWLEREFRGLLLEAAREVKGACARVEVRVAERGAPRERQAHEKITGQHATKPPTASTGISSTLNPRCTFETFVVSDETETAYSAAKAVARYPGKSYNPLYLHGSEGCGKTHLLYAIAHELENTSHLHFRLITAEHFLNEYTKRAAARNLESFRDSLLGLDVLLVDDLQFLAGKRRSIDAFLQIVKSLISDHRQVVIAANAAPGEIPGMPSDLTVMFRWGLLVPVPDPSNETLFAILMSKAARRGLSLEEDAARHVVESAAGSLRALEGMLNHMDQLAREHGRAIDLPVARLATEVSRAGDAEAPKAVGVEDILEAAQQYYDLKPQDLLRRSKVRSVALARQVAMYLTRKLTPLSLEEIGARFGGRDHTTVLYAVNRIEELRKRNPQLKTDLELLLRRLRRSGNP